MSFRNQHPAALNLTFIRRNTDVYHFVLFALLYTYPQVEEVRLSNLEESARGIIRTAGVILKFGPLPIDDYDKPKLIAELGPFQTPLHSCAEPNSIRFDFGVTLERRLIQTAYLHRT